MKHHSKEYRTIEYLSDKYDLSKSFFHKLTFHKLLPFTKSGPGVRSRVLICENDFIRYLEKFKVASVDQIEAQSAITALNH